MLTTRSVLPFALSVLLVPLGRPAAAPVPAADVPSPAAPSAAVISQQRTLIRQAATLLNQGDPTSAIAILQQAQRLHADAIVSYNLGVACAEGRRHPEAAAAFTRFLAQLAEAPSLSKEVQAERVADVHRRVAEYRRSLSRLRVQVAGPQPTDAAADARPPATPVVTIDNRPLLLPDGWLPPGDHEVRVQAPGLSDYSARVHLDAGEERRMQVALAASSAGALPATSFIPTAAPEPPAPVYKRWWFWAAVGGGVVLTSALIGAGAAGKLDRAAPGTDLPGLEVAR